MKKTLTSRIALIAVIVLLGLSLRTWAALQLPVDADEPVYMQVAFDYSKMIRNGDWQGILEYRQNSEHPPLIKLLYSLPILALPSYAGWADALLLARMISVLFGTLAVLVLALFDPLAGGLLAIQTMTVKYTAQTYLEAVPLFASVLAVVTLLTSRKTRDARFWISAAALGLVAASKYSYVPILFVAGYVFIFEKKYPWRDLLVYLVTAGALFFILDPALWLNPIGNLVASIAFHAQYAQGAHVAEVGYPWYQPVEWISQSWPNVWHPNIFFFFSADGAIFILSLAGLALSWNRRRWLIVWYVGALLFLLLWPVKWPQYTLVLTPAICLAAGDTLHWAGNWIKEKEDYWGWFSVMIPNPTRIVLLSFIGVLAVLVVAFVVNTTTVTLNHRGWTHLNATTGSLPASTTYAVLSDRVSKMIAGTSHGAMIWEADPNNPLAGNQTVINAENSPLPGDEVLSLALDDQRGLWFGTRTGLALELDGRWTVYHSGDFGLAGEEVHAMAVDPAGGLWIGTNRGAAYYDGKNWTPLIPPDPSANGQLIFSIAVQRTPSGELVWLGTASGLACWEKSTATWRSLNPLDTGVGPGGVPALLVDRQERLWVGTLGSGLNLWDGSSWQHYRVSNSNLPSNVVQAIFESDQGDLWVASAFHDRPGGLVSRFSGEKWSTYPPYLTGYSGSETVSISQDMFHRLWFGTLTAGVDIYQPNH